MPLVSVVIPAYNHEAFIEATIQSVLDQTFQDFEIVITDDGSSDGTLAIIHGFNDHRIQVFENVTNRGASYTANRCIENSTGKYVAMLSSDDTWLPDKLQKQVDYLESHPDIHAVFTKVNWINEDGNLIVNPDFYYSNIFEVRNRSRYEWLNHFFFAGNCLCHPSSLVRRTVYDEIGLLNPLFANLPDFDFWVRLCLEYEIHILDEKLLNFRHFTLETNASGDNPSNNIRVEYEAWRILDHYKNIRDLETFRKVFPTSHQFNDLEDEDLHFILGKIAIGTGVNYKVLWGQDLLLETLSDPQQVKRIREKFDFDYPDLYKITGSTDIFRSIFNNGSGANSLDSQLPHNTETKTYPDVKFPLKKNKIARLLQQFHLKQDMAIIAQTRLFDKGYYLSQYPDVAQTGMDPIKHYLLYGSNEGRNPSRLFNTKKYLTRYPDVLNSRMNPLIHFICHGKEEGRDPL